MLTIEAKWSGSFPCLCHGQWTLIINGNDVSDKIPGELRTSPMNTFGEYETWSFNDDWSEEWETYTDGLHREDWIKTNKTWLDTITTNPSVQRKIFSLIQEEDWRHGSCGGCI